MLLKISKKGEKIKRKKINTGGEKKGCDMIFGVQS